MHASPGDERLAPVYEFGSFRLNTRRRLLLSDAGALPLTAKAFETLVFLIEQQPRTVTKEELLQHIWPDSVVEEGNLARNISTLRRILGDSPEAHRYILTVPGEGYRFVAQVRTVAEEELESSIGGRLDVSHPDRAAAPSAGAEPDEPVHGRPSGPGEAAHRAEQTETGAASDAASPVAPRREQRRGVRRSRLRSAAIGAMFTLAAAAVAWLAWSTVLPRAERRPIRWIAVLPLENLSADPSQEYFAAGMTEAIIGRLSAVGGLRVISRTSVLQFEDTRRPLPDIARALKVEAVVAGSVLRSGNRVRITAQLIELRSRETSLWSGVFEREIGDVLALQAEVAEAISRNIALTLSGAEKRRLLQSGHVSPEVYEHYLRGRFALTQPNQTAVRDALTHFEAALAVDPAFAPAYTGLSRVYRELGTIFRGAFPQSEMLPKAVAAAERALQLDPNLAEAHLMIAAARQREWQWDQAEAGFRRALELEPSSAAARIGLAHLLAARGRLDEAVQLAQLARALDPLSAEMAANVGWTFYFARRYHEAIRECRDSLQLKHDNHSGLWYLGISLTEASSFDEAVEVLERAAVLSDRSPGLLGSLVNAYARAGRRADALRTLEELTRRRQNAYVPAGAFVHAYAGLGDREQAFAWLARAYDERSNVIWQLNVSPTLDPLRSDGRFTELLRRVGLD